MSFYISCTAQVDTLLQVYLGSLSFTPTIIQFVSDHVEARYSNLGYY